MSGIKVSDVMVDVLEQAGVKHCYGIVGDTLNHFTDSISRSRIEWVHMRHEEAGGFAAGAEALMSHRLAACAGSCGPGSLHFINGLFEANRSRAPVVLIASQLSLEQPAYLDFPQYVDFKSIYKNCSVFCEEIVCAEHARYIMTMACQAALSRRGVAVVIMPANISAEKIDDKIKYQLQLPAPLVLPRCRELDQLIKFLSESNKIAIYAGAGCEFAHDQVVALSQKLQAPVVHTSRGKDFIEHDNPNCVGMTGIFGSKAGYNAIMGCDTLLVLGADFAWSEFYPKHAKIIQIDEDATHLGRRTPITYGVAGHIAPTLDIVLSELEDKSNRSFLEKCLKDQKGVADQTTCDEKRGDSGIVHPQYLVSLLSKYADDDAVLTADTGSLMIWSLRHFQTNGMRRTLTSLIHGTMANALPQALGIKEAFPQRQVIALCGDGGIAMLLGELLTVIQENLNVKIVVLNNGSLNAVEFEQKVEGLIDHYTRLVNPDFGKLASDIGMLGITQTQSEGLKDAIQMLLSHDGPALLDVHATPLEMIRPPSLKAEHVKGFATYAAKASLHGRARDVADMIKGNYIKR